MANLAFENYEVAAYISLIAAARAAGEAEAIPLPEQSLEEEQRMAA
jgi:ferritin-like metal-binding protein YciE